MVGWSISFRRVKMDKKTYITEVNLFMGAIVVLLIAFGVSVPAGVEGAVGVIVNVFLRVAIKKGWL